MVLEKIRPASINDATDIHAIYAPYVEATAISFETIVPTVEEIGARVAETMDMYPWLVYERNEKILGYAYASQYRTREAYRWSVEVSIYLKTGYFRQGIGRKLYESLLGQLEASGFANAFGVIALPNESSVALHESLGFAPVGVFHKVGYKLGAWHDVGWWQKSFGHSDKPEIPGFRNVVDKSGR